MRRVVEPLRSLRWFRLALLATISVAAVSCSTDMQRFDPFRSKSSSNEVTGSVSQPQRQASVQSTPLPPPGSARGSSVASQQSSQGAEATQGHRNWNWEGGTAITVQPGDTIDGLVHR